MARLPCWLLRDQVSHQRWWWGVNHMHAGIHPGFKTQHRTLPEVWIKGISGAKDGLVSSRLFSKKIKQEGLIVEGQLSTFKPVTGSNWTILNIPRRRRRVFPNGDGRGAGAWTRGVTVWCDGCCRVGLWVPKWNKFEKVKVVLTWGPPFCWQTITAQNTTLPSHNVGAGK